MNSQRLEEWRLERTSAHRRSDRSWSVAGEARISEFDMGVSDIRLSG